MSTRPTDRDGAPTPLILPSPSRAALWFIAAGAIAAMCAAIAAAVLLSQSGGKGAPKPASPRAASTADDTVELEILSAEIPAIITASAPLPAAAPPVDESGPKDTAARKD